MPLASGTAGGATFLCEVGLPSGRSLLPSESRGILRSTHLKGGSRSRIVTIIVARERHWSSEEGPQIHSKGGEVKTPSKTRGPFEFFASALLCVAHCQLRIKQDTSMLQAREGSGAHQYAAGSFLAILHDEAQKGWAELVLRSPHPDSST